MSKEKWQEDVSNLPTLLIKRTLRSGQNINYDGNVVVLGDVNPGAEIICSGHILIMGVLRGLVHAGATGDDTATVTALSLNPTQLRISSHITRPPDGGGSINAFLPETARIINNAVIIEKFTSPR